MIGKIVCGLFVLIGVGSLVACSETSNGANDWVWPDSSDSNGPHDTSDGSADDSGQDTGPWDTGSSNTGDSDSVCAELNIDIALIPARLMILQDLSGSMSENENGGDDPPSKWDQARSALNSILGNKNIRVDWGFDSFPGSSGDCGVRWRGLMDTKANNQAMISTGLALLSPGGGTPLYLAMQNFTRRAYAPNFLAPDMSSYLLVVSDGADTCGINGVYDDHNGATPAQLASITTRLLNEFGVQTYVIGFGSGAETSQLNAIAAAGGTERETFFDAENKVQLSTALTNIASSVVSCVYQLGNIDETKVDPDTVNFYFDGEVVKMDAGCAKNLGWTWVGTQKNKVKFCKAACDELQTGEVQKISAKYGCPQVVVQ